LTPSDKLRVLCHLECQTVRPARTRPGWVEAPPLLRLVPTLRRGRRYPCRLFRSGLAHHPCCRISAGRQVRPCPVALEIPGPSCHPTGAIWPALNSHALLAHIRLTGPASDLRASEEREARRYLGDARGGSSGLPRWPTAPRVSLATGDPDPFCFYKCRSPALAYCQAVQRGASPRQQGLPSTGQVQA
jgi:hypothetical protein